MDSIRKKVEAGIVFIVIKNLLAEQVGNLSTPSPGTLGHSRGKYQVSVGAQSGHSRGKNHSLCRVPRVCLDCASTDHQLVC
jgi:hypothetical protein